MASFADRVWQWIYKIAYRVLVCFWFVFRPKSRGVYVAVWYKDEVLLIRNSYRPDRTFPGGGIRWKEAVDRAAARELSEEVGIHVRPGDLRLVGEFFVYHDFTRDAISLFEIRLPVRPRFRTDNREVVWAEFMPLPEALGFSLFPLVRAYLEVRAGEEPGG